MLTSAADCHFLLGNESIPTSTNSFQDSMWSLESIGLILMENMSSGRFSAGPHNRDPPAPLGEILDSGRLAAKFARLEIIGLLYLQCFAGESPSDASC